MAVFVGVPVVTAEADLDPRHLFRAAERLIEMTPDCFKGDLFAQGEIEILGKAVVGDVAFLDRRAAFEGEDLPERGRGQADEKPGEAVILFQDGLRDASPLFPGEAV